MHLCDMVVIASWAVGTTFTPAPAEKGSRVLAHFWQGDLMANDSKDDSVLGHIDGLVMEEERLYAKQGLTDEDRNRLEKIKVELDQYWDLLRQRRALREFGRDPNQAKVRRMWSKTTSSSSSGFRFGFIVWFPGPSTLVPRGSHRENAASSEIREQG